MHLGKLAMHMHINVKYKVLFITIHIYVTEADSDSMCNEQMELRSVTMDGVVSVQTEKMSHAKL